MTSSESGTFFFVSSCPVESKWARCPTEIVTSSVDFFSDRSARDLPTKLSFCPRATFVAPSVVSVKKILGRKARSLMFYAFDDRRGGRCKRID